MFSKLKKISLCTALIFLISHCGTEKLSDTADFKQVNKITSQTNGNFRITCRDKENLTKVKIIGSDSACNISNQHNMMQNIEDFIFPFLGRAHFV